MEIELISRDIIKPSAIDIHKRKPFKLSLFDQLFGPANYCPIIIFYQHSNNIVDVSAQLKKSLSETLSAFYIYAGRVKDNLYIDDYEEGVPFIDTKVNICLSDFLQDPQIHKLNQFLPCTPIVLLSKLETKPLLAIQLNTFKCGGTALGVTFLHKVFDEASGGAFLKSWAAHHTSESGSNDLDPNLVESALRFPPIESPLRDDQLFSKTSDLLTHEKKITVERYVFYAKSIATLRQRAISEGADNPTRIQTVSSFLWKCFSTAALKVSNSPRPCLSFIAVNIRQRASPPLPKDSPGNAFLFGVADYNLADTDKMDLRNFVTSTREAITNVNTDLVNKLQGEGGPEAVSHLLGVLDEFLPQKPEILVFVSWLHLGIHDLEFGWGKPIWAAVLGEVSQAYNNLTCFKETGPDGEDLEAWMLIDETKMAIMERDPEFRAFATRNPSVLPKCV